ncbi:MAG: pentapeptide repeat-containing protein [Hyphomicrobiaceae bacterium]
MNDVPKGSGPFDASAWKERLLALNPWARGLRIDEEDKAFEAAQHKATLDRYVQGREAWKAWANSMLGFKEQLRAAGRLESDPEEEEDWDDERKRGGGTTEAHLWRNLAVAFFSSASRRQTIEPDWDFENFTFPGDVEFEDATFSGECRFKGAVFNGTAWFERATFSSVVFFTEAKFHGSAMFEKTTFSGYASFVRATFSSFCKFQDAKFDDTASFEDATFQGYDNWFWGIKFAGSALFGRCKFSKVSFEGTNFSQYSRFHYATFRDAVRFVRVTSGAILDMSSTKFFGPADFSRSKFQDTITLDRSAFAEAAVFDAINSQTAFSLAAVTFRHVPSFIGATFSGTLRLDNVQTPRYRLLGWTADKDAPARFRELKRRAAEAKDHDRELEFFAQEIRTSRFNAKGLPAYVPRVWEWRFWFGLFYGTFSDFGRSLWRPLSSWIVLFVLFAAFYLGEHPDMRKARGSDAFLAYAETTFTAWRNPPACRPQGKDDPNRMFATTNAVNEALYLSFNNGLLFLDSRRADVARRVYGCLYGLDRIGDQDSPVVPYRVSVASTIQSLLSAVLIFLFLLAVRNLLRLK